jgi:hypothetical protein
MAEHTKIEAKVDDYITGNCTMGSAWGPSHPWWQCYCLVNGWRHDSSIEELKESASMLKEEKEKVASVTATASSSAYACLWVWADHHRWHVRELRSEADWICTSSFRKSCTSSSCQETTNRLAILRFFLQFFFEWNARLLLWIFGLAGSCQETANELGSPFDSIVRVSQWKKNRDPEGPGDFSLRREIDTQI